jgi:hypothetical protein
MGTGRLCKTRTDFYEHYQGISPLQNELISCQACGFVGRREWWPLRLTESERDCVLGFFGPQRSAHTLEDSFERAAQIAELSHQSDIVRADLWLRASWAAVLANDRESERYYQRFAIRYFSRAALDSDSTESTVKIWYLCGELNRRIVASSFLPTAQRRACEVASETWFQQVIESDGPEWLQALARQQLFGPHEWFS